MEQQSLLYTHFPHLAAATPGVYVAEAPDTLLRRWQQNPPAGTPDAELAALDMALACLFKQVAGYFNTNAFADLITAAAEMLTAAKQEENKDLTVQLAEALADAMTAADTACRGEQLQQAAEEPQQP